MFRGRENENNICLLHFITFESIFISTSEMALKPHTSPISMHFLISKTNCMRFLLVIIATAMMIACNDDKSTKEVLVKDDSGAKATVAVDQAKVDEMNKKAEALQKLQPLSLEELKAVLPESIMGTKSSNYNATSMNGVSFAIADYKFDDTTDIQVMVYDCAGPAGAGLYTTQFGGLIRYESENDRGYTKTIDFLGNNAIEQYTKDNENHTVTYLANDRYLVTLKGKNIALDGLKEAARGLKLK